MNRDRWSRGTYCPGFFYGEEFYQGLVPGAYCHAEILPAKFYRQQGRVPTAAGF